MDKNEKDKHLIGDSQRDMMDEYLLFTCHECGWEGEGVELTDDGECPKCYALLDEQ